MKEHVMSSKWNKIKLPDILAGHRDEEPKIDPDDVVEVYGPAEMLGAIGNMEEPDPDDVSDDNDEEEFSFEAPAPLYGPFGSF